MFVYYGDIQYWVDYYQDSSFVGVGNVSLDAVKSEDLDLFSLYAPWYDGSIESLNSAGFGDIGSVSATGSGSLPSITLAAITGSADNSMVLNGNGSGALAAITLNAITGNASGNASAGGVLAGATLTALAGGANGAAVAGGSLSSITLNAISGGASGNAVGAGVLPSISLSAITGGASGSASANGTGSGLLPSITLTALTGGATGDGSIQPIHGYSFENDRRLLKARRDKERLDKLDFAEQLEAIKPQIAKIAQTDTEAATAFVDRITALVPKQQVQSISTAIDYPKSIVIDYQSDSSDDEAIALIVAALL